LCKKITPIQLVDKYFKIENSKITYLNPKKYMEHDKIILAFLKTAKDSVCSWGSKIDGICQTMRAYGISYSVKSKTKNIIEYSYMNSNGFLMEGILLITE
jgi:hypothetical protein